MLLTDWAREKGRGAFSTLADSSGVTRKTIRRSARDGLAIKNIEVAQALSEATRPIPNDPASGEPAVSVLEICYPERFRKRAPVRHRRAS